MHSRRLRGSLLLVVVFFVSLLPPPPPSLALSLSAKPAQQLPIVDTRSCTAPSVASPPAGMDAALQQKLVETARALVADGKGILAADESTGTVGKRLASIGVENTEPNRAALRQLLFTSEGLERAISGVILYEETLFQQAPGGAQGERLVDALTQRGVRLGIKVDTGVAPLPAASSDSESYTQGLDGLAARCARYAAAGAVFAKWRAVIHVREPGSGGLAALPSEAAVEEAARGLALYAATAQRAGLVPIVEPEVLSDGAHALAACEAATTRVLSSVFAALLRQGVLLEGILLKPNMVTSGAQAPAQATPGEVAAATLRVLRRTVPPAVPGVVFLSGGQSELDATRHLALMAADRSGATPWALSFSYGRALQASALKAWGGQPGNVAAAQAAFLARAAANSAATRGQQEDGATAS